MEQILEVILNGIEDLLDTLSGVGIDENEFLGK